MKKYWIIFITILLTLNTFIYIKKNDYRKYLSSNPIFYVITKIELNFADCDVINEYIDAKIKYSYISRNINDLKYLKKCNIKEFNFINNYETIKIDENDYIFFVYKYIYYLNLDKVKKNIIQNNFKTNEAKKILTINKLNN